MCRLSQNVQTYGTAGQATDGNVIRRLPFECWITKVISTNSVYVILTAWQRGKMVTWTRLNIYAYMCVASLVCVVLKWTLGAIIIFIIFTSSVNITIIFNTILRHISSQQQMLLEKSYRIRSTQPGHLLPAAPDNNYPQPRTLITRSPGH
jgi:hypothetical protein